jgi:hypothetical protein
MLSLSANVQGGAGHESACLAYPASLPEIFGPVVWWSVHTMAATYPESASPERTDSCAQFVRGLPGMLPCSACGAHLSEELRSVDVESACGGGRALSLMWCDVHNRVNRRLGKPLMNCADAQSEYGAVPVCNPARALAPRPWTPS